jgi:hypothetical protein
MRIAVSGSHSLGKSTVVSNWIARLRDYVREEEPYRALALHGPYEILFREASTRLHNGIQLYYNIGRVHRYVTSADKVIFDRAPVDYLAYSQYTANQRSTDIDDAFVQSMVPAVREALDILAFVPQSDSWPVGMEDDGIRPVDQPYRADVDAIFKQIYRDSRFNIMPLVNSPLLIELVGTPEERLRQLSDAVEKRAGLSS